MNVDVGALMIYFLICHMVLPSALFTYSFHFLALARSISCIYSSDFAFHAALSTESYVRPNILLRRFASLRSLDSSAVHHRLLGGFGRFRGVVSSTTVVIAGTIVSAHLSISASVV